MKCGVVRNAAYDVVHVQGSAGDKLGPAYNMDSNPLYEMRIMSNEHTRQLVLMCMRLLTLCLYEADRKEEGNVYYHPAHLCCIPIPYTCL